MFFIFTSGYRGFVVNHDRVEDARDLAEGSQFFRLTQEQEREFVHEFRPGFGPGFNAEFEVPRRWIS